VKRLTRGVILLLALGVVLVLSSEGVGPSSGAGSPAQLVLLTLRDLSPSGAMPTRRAVTDFHCSSRASLTARIQPGATWQRHRHSLELMSDYDSSPYIIVNGRTQAIYHWGYEGPNNIAKAVFGVPTSFAILNPGWERDPWILLYDCA
jgi:hypothetical protein